MVSSFFASVAFYLYAYYLVGYAVCLRRLYLKAAESGAVEGVGSAPATADEGRCRPYEYVDAGGSDLLAERGGALLHLCRLPLLVA
jgi:hypothetical protein